jgi:Ca2+-binding EF-hand superfamily protein
LSALPATKSWEQQQTELLQTIATQGATAQTGQDAILKATQEGFAYLDTTADGLLTLDELKTGLAGIATDEQIKAMVTRVDANGDGFITQLELAVAAVGTLETNLVAKLATEFATLDTTADGLLTLDELKTGLAGIATDEQIKALVTRVDLNADGQIDELELLRAVTGKVDTNTSDAVLRAEQQVAQMRDLVAETIVNSSKLNTLNASIGELTAAITAANEAERVARTIEIKQAEGFAKTADIDKLENQYKPLYDEAAKKFADTILNLTNPLFGAKGFEGALGDNWSRVFSAVNAGNIAEAVRIINQAGLQPAGYEQAIHFSLATPDAVNAGNYGVTGTGPHSAYYGPGTAFNASTTAALTYSNRASGTLNTAADELEALRQQIRDLGGVPQFAVGTNYVPNDMLAMLHEGEAVVPKAYNPAAMPDWSSYGRAENAALIAEIKALRAEVSELRAEARSTAVATSKTARILDRVTPDGNSLQTVAAA